MTDEPLLAGRTENLPAIEYDQFEEPTRVITVQFGTDAPASGGGE